ncbi:LD-carboxypeptidase [Flavobacteriaceae bacterium S356]|uniref:LD-carboxypeptidase n=1 Tax=Asprobacillus argus TaxID=3076534 RepID=A0ABU3LCU4_9FLAO|nr:LD-carboxypeptidase [Flavobacteriaceae bacterium S356]
MNSKHLLQWIIVFFLLSNFTGNSQKKKDALVKKTMELKRPKYLQKGDTIAIVATAGILKNKEEAIAKAKATAESWGLHVIIGKNIFNQNHHFAGTDKERTNDFQKALDDPNIKAIWGARGGYGSVRILDKINFEKFKQQPKWIIGYSDVTAIHSHIHNMGIETIHGMMGTSFDFDLEENKESIETLRKTLFGEKMKYEITTSKYNRKGKAKGQLVGGNLTILLTMLGSESQLNTKDKILFIEEIGEYKYHIDRMLQSFKRAGYFDNLKGLIIGDMSNIKKNTTKWGSTIEQLILDAVSEYDFPVVFDFPAGHEIDNRALLLGREVEILSKKSKTYLDFTK